MRGINDNNFNRKTIPSNQYPLNGGYVGHPNGRYNPISTNSLKNNNFSNFDIAYKNNTPIIEQMDYTNYNNILHNNIGENVLDEHIVEYKINIDSLDRDIQTYPNPFSFRVQFDALSNGNVRTEKIKNGELVRVNDYFVGAPGPKINKRFKNIKYIKLDSIVLPQYTKTITNDCGDIVFDQDSYLVDDRFVMISIDELDEHRRVYSTGDSGFRVDPITGHLSTIPKSFGIIYPDTKLGRVYYTGTPYNSNKIYNSSDLGNINKLTIKFYDSYGQLLEYNDLCSYNELKEAADNCEPISINCLRHPLNKKIQVHLSFVIGVVESQINKNTKFEK